MYAHGQYTADLSVPSIYKYHRMQGWDVLPTGTPLKHVSTEDNATLWALFPRSYYSTVSRAQIQLIIDKANAHVLRYQWIAQVRNLKGRKRPTRRTVYTSHPEGVGFLVDTSGRRLKHCYDQVAKDKRKRFLAFIDDGRNHQAIAYCDGNCGYFTWAQSFTHRSIRDPHTDTTTTVHKCGTCLDLEYRGCSGCGNFVHRRHAENHGDRFWCPDHSAYCESCSGWYYSRGAEHFHPRGAANPHGRNDVQCAPLPLEFSFSTPSGMVTNDSEHTVTLPGGSIDQVGIDSIYRIIALEFPNANDIRIRSLFFDQYATAYGHPHITHEWLTTEGTYTKRLARHLYKLGIKIPPALLSEVGNIAQAHTSPNVAHKLTLTRDLNQLPQFYGHQQSCWWGGYSLSRCALKAIGGLALRAWTEDGVVMGRCWVIPFDATMTPTISLDNVHAWMVFNAYGVFGERGGYVGARLFAELTGLTYKKMEFRNNAMYVNNHSGVLVAPHEVCAKTAEVNIFPKGWTHP